MGVFGPSKQERAAMAARLEERATENASRARQQRAEAAEVRDRNRRAIYKDPEATRVIAGQLEASARVAEAAARNAKAEAEQARKPWWRR